MQYPRIIFMGTPEFAVASMVSLIEAGYHIVAVVTAPDRPAGRGKQISMSAVKTAALRYHIPVLQPEKLKSEDFLESLRLYHADLQIVVAFRMLPEVVWNMPPMGTFNLHASLLPQYRGAAPINHALLNGDTQTGVTTFLLDHAIDTGKVLLQETTAIDEDDDAGSLHDKLMNIGSRLVVETVKGLTDHSITPMAQSDSPSSEPIRHAPKIFKEDGQLHWNLPGREIQNKVRGLSPYPAAWTTMRREDGTEVSLKIFRVIFTEGSSSSSIGQLTTDQKSHLSVTVPDGMISIIELQQAGKKRMAVEEFLRGSGNLTGAIMI